MPSLFGSILSAVGGDMRKKEESTAEDAQWEKRQRLMNKLNLEQSEAMAKTKTEAGSVEKIGEQYFVQDKDGNGNPKGPKRQATQAEIRAYQSGDYELEGKKLGLDVERIKARDADEMSTLGLQDKRLGIEQTRQQMQMSRNADARASSAEARSAAESRGLDGEGSKGQKAAIRNAQENAEYLLNTLPKGDSESQAIIKAYNDEMNGANASGATFFVKSQILNKYKARAAAKLAAYKAEAKGGSVEGFDTQQN